MEQTHWAGRIHFKYMINSDDIKKIEKLVEEFFQKMTISARINIKVDSSILEDSSLGDSGAAKNQNRDVLGLNIKIDDPQILIGERGQTLNETQRLLRVVLNKKLDKIFYLNLDINDYKKKKTEYLKSLAKDLADEVVLTKEKKVLSPMPSYERRIIHEELAIRTDVVAESEGEEPYRMVVIKPR